MLENEFIGTFNLFVPKLAVIPAIDQNPGVWLLVRQSRRQTKGRATQDERCSPKGSCKNVENIVNAVLTAARRGDMTAAKIILDRIVPVRRSNSSDI
jgi:hypothetical protein